MCFWNSLAFSVIQQMLAIWPLVPLPFLNLSCTPVKFLVHVLLSLAWRVLSITLLACEMNAIVLLFEHSWITSLLWQKSLCNSMKLWAMPCRATQNGHVIEETSDKISALEEGMANHSNFLVVRTPWTVWKGEKIWHWKMNSPRSEGSSMLLGKSRGQLLIAPERMKCLDQRRNDTQLWMYLVVKVKSSALRTLLHTRIYGYPCFGWLHNTAPSSAFRCKLNLVSFYIV